MKAELLMIKGIASMIHKILHQAIENGLNTQSVLKQVMAKLLGECMMCKQETTHLILQIPIVSCSHKFIKINLSDDVNRLDIEGSIDEKNYKKH